MTLTIDQRAGLLLTTAGDIDFSSRRLQWASGIEGVVQGVRWRMQLIRGELFYNLAKGVPWYLRDGVPKEIAILGRRFELEKMRSALRAPILATPGIRSIVKLDILFNAATRAASASWEANTIWSAPAQDITPLGVVA